MSAALGSGPYVALNAGRPGVARDGPEWALGVGGRAEVLATLSEHVATSTRVIIALVTLISFAVPAEGQRFAPVGARAQRPSEPVALEQFQNAMTARETTARVLLTTAGAVIGLVVGVGVWDAAFYDDASACSGCKAPNKGAWPRSEESASTPITL